MDGRMDKGGYILNKIIFRLFVIFADARKRVLKRRSLADFVTTDFNPLKGIDKNTENRRFGTFNNPLKYTVPMALYLSPCFTATD
jgi:hypothetical protein